MPSEQSALLALRTQQVVGHEIGVTDTVDPLAGSYYIESLTDHIEEEVLGYIAHIDQIGGAVEAIENGFIQQEIQASAYQYQKEIEAQKRVVVGVNSFTTSGEQPVDLLKMDPATSRRQVERLKEVRLSRDQGEVASALQDLRKAAQSDDNLMPYILTAVKAYATLGEICGALKDIFGEYQQQITM